MACAKSEKFDKMLMNKKIRRISKNILQNVEEGEIDCDDVVFPEKDEVMNQWDMAKDGKGYYSPYRDSDKDWFQKGMRK
jgi:hypothetical protein